MAFPEAKTRRTSKGMKAPKHQDNVDKKAMKKTVASSRVKKDPVKKKPVSQIAPFKGKKTLSEKEINLMKRRLNDGKIKSSDLRKLKPISSGDGFKLTKQQNEKARKFLINLGKTPRGTERKDNPFGFREETLLEENFREIRLIDFRNISRVRGFNNFVPLWEVQGKKESDGSFNTFQYNQSPIRGEVIEIVG